MKRLLRNVVLMGVVLFCLCGTAFAVESPSSGIYNLEVENSVTATPQTADGIEMEAETVQMNGEQVSGFYPNAEKLEVTYQGAAAGSQYLILGLNDDSNIPTAGNIVYIDQQLVLTDASVTFSLYPSSLETGKTYSIYLSSNADTGITGLTKVASFQYHVPYILGDVDLNERVTAADAQAALQISVGLGDWGEISRLAADFNGDGDVTAADALEILKASVGL